MADDMVASRTATRTVLLLAAVALTLVTSSASAHTGATSTASSVVAAPVTPSAGAVASRIEFLAAAPAPDVPLWVALAGLVLVALLLRAPRRVAATTFALLIAVLAFETGVHAVHHLGDRHAASHCAVASVAPHVGGTTDPPSTGMPSLDVSADAVIVADAAVLPAPSLGAYPGPAPPALPV
jgi:hypothetical protein